MTSSSSIKRGCWYDAYLSPRSMVFDGDLTAVKGHGYLSYDLETEKMRWSQSLDENNAAKCYSYWGWVAKVMVDWHNTEGFWLVWTFWTFCLALNLVRLTGFIAHESAWIELMTIYRWYFCYTNIHFMSDFCKQQCKKETQMHRNRADLNLCWQSLFYPTVDKLTSNHPPHKQIQGPALWDCSIHGMYGLSEHNSY